MGGIFTREERAVVLFLTACVIVGSLALGVGRVDPSASADGSADAAVEETAARVNINAADRVELERLPGVGPARAAEILRLRSERGGFTSVDELLDVNGIGPVTLERLRPFAAIADTDSTQHAEHGGLP